MHSKTMKLPKYKQMLREKSLESFVGLVSIEEGGGGVGERSGRVGLGAMT